MELSSVYGTIKCTLCAVCGNFCTWNSQAYINFNAVHGSFVHGTLRRTFNAVHGSFVRGTLRRTFCAVNGSFCTWHSQVYILCCKWQLLYMALSSAHFVLKIVVFLYMALSRLHFVLYMANLVHGPLRCKFCAENCSFIHDTFNGTLCLKR